MAKKKRKISEATRERLRAMRKKYGLGEFKSRGSSEPRENISLKKRRKSRSVESMARRRKSRRSFFPRAKRYARSRSGKKALSEVALISYAVVGENLFDQLTSNIGVAGLPPRVVKIGVGYMLKKKSGLLGQMGTAMYTIELYKLGKDIASGGLNLGNLLGGSSASAGSSAMAASFS